MQNNAMKCIVPTSHLGVCELRQCIEIVPRLTLDSLCKDAHADLVAWFQQSDRSEFLGLQPSLGILWDEEKGSFRPTVWKLPLFPTTGQIARQLVRNWFSCTLPVGCRRALRRQCLEQWQIMEPRCKFMFGKRPVERGGWYLGACIVVQRFKPCLQFICCLNRVQHRSL